MSAGFETVSKAKNAGETLWLVKSGELILGPFTTAEVAKRLIAREIMVIDEIADPQKRWRLIRDEPAFAEFVEETRKGIMNAREETEVSALNSTQVIFRNEAKVEDSADLDITPVSDIQGTQNAQTQAHGEGQILDAEFTEDEGQAQAAQAAAGKKLKQFGMRARTAEFRHASVQVKVMWAAAFLVVCAAVYMVATVKRPSGPERETVSVDYAKVVQGADRAWQKGDFGLAEKLYGQANRIKPLQPEVVARLAPLMIQLEGQTVEAKRLLSDTLHSMDGSNPRLHGELQLGLALAAMVSLELQDAEQLLTGAKAELPNSSVPDFNLGMLSFLGNQFEEAARRFSLAGEDPMAMFMRVRSLAATPKKHGGRKEAAAILNKLTKEHFDFRQEGEVLSAALLIEAGNKKIASTRVRLALDSDPEMTADHWHDPLLYQLPVGWKSLVGVCRRIQDGLKSNLSRALLALCLGQAAQGEEAMRVLNEGLATDGEDQMLQAVNSELLFNASRDEDARGALRIALRHEPAPLLARFVKARLCFRHSEFACAEEEWKVLQDGRTQKLAALIGLAQIDLKNGAIADAQDLVAKSLSASPRYKPALALREGDSQ